MLTFMSKAAACLAVALIAAGAHGQRSNEAREFHVTFPLQDHVGNVLKPSLLEGLDIFTRDIAKHIKSNAVANDEQWEEEAFFKQNNVSNSSAFCFTVANNNGSVTRDGTEEIMPWTAGTFADNQTAGVTTSAVPSAVGHWCCQGHVPNISQLASSKCYRTDTPGALDQFREAEGLLQATVGADGSTRMGSVKEHRSGLMRSADSMEAQGGHEADDPRIFPSQIFMASLRDGVSSESLDFAAEQVAHLARATSGLIVVDKRLLGRLMKELGSHPARFRVIEKPFWLFVFYVCFGMAKLLGGIVFSAAARHWWR